MNIVITGGSGFVGSYLCERLINDGHNLIVVDNLLTGSTENISDLMDNDNFSFIEHDVQNHIELKTKLTTFYILQAQHHQKHTLSIPLIHSKQEALEHSIH